MKHRMPPPSSDAARTRMRAVRQRDTAAEHAVAEALRARGIAFESQLAIVPGVRRRVDFVILRQRIALFIDGCFWHGCPLHATHPRANALAWQQKLTANQARDADTDRRLQEAGWTVLRFWEHEPAEQVAEATSRLLEEWDAEAADLAEEPDGSQ